MVHLEEEMRAHAEVWAIAPDRERSATSQAISIRETLRLIQVRPQHFMLTGYPADCVNAALHSRKFPVFDLIISGINHGVNLGDDVHYSGTVGAARHAAIHGYRAIAVSCPIRSHQGDFRRIAFWLRTWIQENQRNIQEGIVYNINYPEEINLPLDAPFPEERFTAQGRRRYYDTYEDIEEGADYWIMRLKDTQMGDVITPGSDFEAMKDGFVSITPLNTYTTHFQEIERWKNFNQTEKKRSLKES